MASFKTLTNVEKVRPNDGQRETAWLLAAVGLILLLAFFGLHYNRAQVKTETAHLALDVNGRAMLTALSNAADEIGFIATDAVLTLVELVELGIPPFAPDSGPSRQYRWQQVTDHCLYATPVDPAQAVFIFKQGTAHAQVYWRFVQPDAVDCSDLSQWQTMHHHE